MQEDDERSRKEAQRQRDEERRALDHEVYKRELEAVRLPSVPLPLSLLHSPACRVLHCSGVSCCSPLRCQMHSHLTGAARLLHLQPPLAAAAAAAAAGAGDVLFEFECMCSIVYRLFYMVLLTYSYTVY